jgi:hypothetical protein
LRHLSNKKASLNQQLKKLGRKFPFQAYPLLCTGFAANNRWHARACF